MKVDKFVQIYDSALQEHEQQVLARFPRSEASDPADILVLKRSRWGFIRLPSDYCDFDRNMIFAI